MAAQPPLDVCELAPDYVKRIAPYQPGKPISELAREMNLDPAKIIKLASNENPLGVSPRARAALEREIAGLSLYPDGSAFELKQAVSARYGWPADGIVVGNGSNDVLEIAAIALLGAGGSAVFSQHAFAVYPLATIARGARPIQVPARHYGHDLDAMARAIVPDTRMVFIANPNNPTGTYLDPEQIGHFLARVPKQVCVVIDEAYNEYLPPPQRFDSVRWLHQHSNVVIVRTFSKIYGLAGLRVGFGLADPRIIDLFNRVRQPFNVNNLALAAAEAALDDEAFLLKSYETNRAGMAQLEAGFRALGLAFIPPSGNFVTVEIPRSSGKSQAAAVFDRLLRRGVIVRPVAGYELPDHLRVTIGTPEENTAFLAALEASLKG